MLTLFQFKARHFAALPAPRGHTFHHIVNNGLSTAITGKLREALAHRWMAIKKEIAA